LRAKPWSNITEIVRESGRILRAEPPRQDVHVRKPTRKTVRKHLGRMLLEGKVWNIRFRYILMEDVYGKSYELDSLVRKVLCQNAMEDVNYAFVHNTAGCYLTTQPALPSELVVATALHQQEAVRFARELFWLEELVILALRHGRLSRKALSKKGIDFTLLSRGLKRSFGNTELILLTFALNPPELLNFLETPSGQALAKKSLEEKRDDILRKARMQPYSKRQLGLITSFSYDSL
jgi:hypothetical protein